MHVRAYVDGFNTYYGGRALACGSAGWKWLDLRALVTHVAQRHWADASIDRVVYCTARIHAHDNPSGHRDQDVYLKALLRSGSVDWIEHGRFYEKTKVRPLATAGRNGMPIITRSGGPVLVKDAAGGHVPEARFMVTVADREEKGSDVNVASHLLVDAITRSMDAAMVVSNDSDLAYPIHEARRRLPVGVVNPGAGRTAGALVLRPAHGPGRQWEDRLHVGDLTAHQLSDPCHGYAKPVDW